ncbi:hypothetical protein [Paenibacillus daejeonensis]|uniref:hypothetical protein n=1 Tax=Paenibacillus daejeonensis TaxID=135193 RepID=UPI00036FD392|nr:hypothetical protein [Paenibacillus daejeonensis]
MNRPKKNRSPNSIPQKQAPARRQGPLISSEGQLVTQNSIEQNVIFSWKYFDRQHDYFNCGNIDADWYLKCIDTMKDISTMRMMEFKQSGGKPLRVHTHDWNDVRAIYDLNPELFEQVKDESYQFALSTGSGRVHGFIIKNVFFVVWFDPEHKLYSRGKVPKCDPPDLCFDCYRAEIDALEEEREMMYSEIEQAIDDERKTIHASIKKIIDEENLKRNRNDIY